MELLNHASLKPFVTFGVEAACDHLYRIDDPEELKVAAQYLEKPLILGGGSNILPIGDIHRNVLRIELAGVEVVKKMGADVFVRVAAGEAWHSFVLWALELNLGGIENLSLIPGTMGAAPMQNIGAYGVELISVFEHLEAIEIGTGKMASFTKEQCRFGYRDSVFKNEAKDKYIITSVTLRLSEEHRINTSYGAIQETLQKWGITKPTIQDVSRAVIEIRQSKLADPARIGNAGSFFKNPVIPNAQFEGLKKNYPELPGYPDSSTRTKVPAGWLVEKAGWKGKRIGDAGSFEKQALVLVNHGHATGAEIWALAIEIIRSVEEMFNIALHPEVNIWRSG